MGRPITDIVSELVYPDLPDDAREVQRTLVFSTKVVTTRDGRWFSVQIMPYRTLDNRIEGVVITFVDITTYKKINCELTEARTYAEAIIATVREPLLVLDSTAKIMSANQSFLRIFLVAKEEVEGRDLYTLGNGQWDIPNLRKLIETILPEHSSFENFRVEYDFPVIGHRVLLLNARQIVFEGSNRALVLLAFEDVTGTGRVSKR
jgi:two-component system CheB/CheR fusion protein